VLFLARDPLGIKPLYYTQAPEGFAFASEVRALATGGAIERKLSQDALTSYLLFGSVSEPVTMFEGVFSLPPGHRMLLFVPDRRKMPRAHPWWDLRRSPAGRDPQRPRDFPSAVRQLRPLLEEAVRAHLIADVPVGLFLSSGLDRERLPPWRRASIGDPEFHAFFSRTPYDESELTRAVAARCGTQHKEVPLEGDAVVARLGEALDALDQPTMDGVNTYFVSWRRAKLDSKLRFPAWAEMNCSPGIRRSGQCRARTTDVAGGIDSSCTAQSDPRIGSGRDRNRDEQGDRSKSRGDLGRQREAASCLLSGESAFCPRGFALADRAAVPPRAALPRMVSRWKPTWMGWLQRAADEARHMGTNGAVSWLEMRSYMASTLLRDTDSVSMAKSLELRVPLLDTPLVEFVCALPEFARTLKGMHKALLVGAIGDLLPAEIAGQKKRTFTLHGSSGCVVPLRPPNGSELYRYYPRAGATPEARRSSGGLGSIPCREDDLVAAMGTVCSE